MPCLAPSRTVFHTFLAVALGFGIAAPLTRAGGQNTMGMSSGGGDAGAALVQGASGLVQLARTGEGLTQASITLRTNLGQLSAKLIVYGGYTARDYQDANRARQVASSMDSLINALTSSSVISSLTLANNIKSDVQAYGAMPMLNMLFAPQPPSGQCVWDNYIAPYIMASMIKLQATYASAIINYISQNVGRLLPNEVQALNVLVQGQLSQFATLGN